MSQCAKRLQCRGTVWHCCGTVTTVCSLHCLHVLVVSACVDPCADVGIGESE
ncbi:hypothetical protein M758_1G188000 [Ceratodon purpureus]|nr:hypothetical protein M758_1G188000 [Ceratodon purpureus]